MRENVWNVEKLLIIFEKKEEPPPKVASTDQTCISPSRLSFSSTFFNDFIIPRLGFIEIADGLGN